MKKVKLEDLDVLIAAMSQATLAVLKLVGEKDPVKAIAAMCACLAMAGEAAGLSKKEITDLFDDLYPTVVKACHSREH